MPLIKSKSKKAFEQNLKAEMKAGKPQDQSLAIAYNVKSKARKKMAEGGGIMDRLKSEYEGVKEAIRTGGTQYSIGKQAEQQKINQDPSQEMKHRPVEPFKSPRSYAEGGSIMRKTPLSNTRMAESSVIKSRPLDEEDMMIEEKQEERPAMEMAPEEEMSHESLESPEHEASESMSEEEAEHHDSIVDAIMAKRAKMANGGIAERAVPEHEDDSSLLEGEVDIDDNNRELPNSFYNRNEDASLKENYDEDFMDLSQPFDSNEHGDISSEETADDDSKDIVSKIRSKMAHKRLR